MNRLGKRLLASVGPIGAMVFGTAAMGQTDYYNTDRDRPVRIEDAAATEQYALEGKLAPLRLQRYSSGGYEWEFHPEVAYGAFPRTSLEVGLPFRVEEDPEHGGVSVLVEAIAFSVLHNFNMETRTVPALAVRADLTVSAEEQTSGRLFPALTGIMTRTWPIARFHVNALYRWGEDRHGPEPGLEVHGLERWLAGIAVDRALPLEAILLTASVHASRSIAAARETGWETAVGARYQVSPILAFDAGMGARFGDAAGLFATFGSAVHFGVRSLIPGVR